MRLVAVRGRLFLWHGGPLTRKGEPRDGIMASLESLTSPTTHRKTAIWRLLPSAAIGTASERDGGCGSVEPRSWPLRVQDCVGERCPNVWRGSRDLCPTATFQGSHAREHTQTHTSSMEGFDCRYRLHGPVWGEQQRNEIKLPSGEQAPECRGILVRCKAFCEPGSASLCLPQNLRSTMGLSAGTSGGYLRF